ncbi:MAG TPA: hypothetical protein PKL73_20935, partial [Polyangiaceae bacterium]|nr:hypothetical protein [Polyangiaceae bacterium]
MVRSSAILHGIIDDTEIFMKRCRGVMKLGTLVVASCLAGLVACGTESGGGYSSSPTADAGADAHGEGGTEAQAETGPIEHKLSSILVEPTNSLVELDLNAVSSQPYTALGRFLDGTTEDVTDKVTWTLSDPEIGVFSGASL